MHKVTRCFSSSVCRFFLGLFLVGGLLALGACGAGDAGSDAAEDPAAGGPAAGGTATWQVTLENRDAGQLTLQVNEATAAAITGTPAGFALATRSFTLAQGGTSTFPLPCAVDFVVVTVGGDNRINGTVNPPDACANATINVRVVFTIEGILRHWTVTVDNRANFTTLSLQVSDDTEAGFAWTPEGYAEGRNTFTLVAGAKATATLACGVNFAIVRGGTATNQAGTLESPQDCATLTDEQRLAAAQEVLLGSPTWEVRLSNPTAVELTLQVHSSTAAAIPANTVGYDGTDTFTLGAGANTTATLPCGVDFRIAGGTATANTDSADSPPDCVSAGNTSLSLSLALTRHLIQRSSLTAMGSAGDTSSHTYTAIEDGRVFAYTTGATGEVQLQVTGPDSLDISDTEQQGVGANAALAFDATASETYTLSFTNASATEQANLRLQARPAAPFTSRVTAVAMGSHHSCFLLNTRAYCVGYNGRGRLGSSSLAIGDSLILLREIDILGSGITAISAGYRHTCALQSGRAYCWGDGDGRLGNGSTADKNTPTAVNDLTSGVTAISVGPSFTCAIHSGAAKCWGSGGSGQLGNGTQGNADCLDARNFPGMDGTDDCSLTPVQVSGLGSGVTAISAGTAHTCAIHAVSGNAAAKCWGLGGNGRLGNGTNGDFDCSTFYSGNDCSRTPVQVSGLTSGVTAISAGSSHTCAIHTVGENAAAKCWGRGSISQLGNGGTSNSSSPVQVSSLTSGVTAISAGSSHTCAIHKLGSATAMVKCWGYGAYGQLGNGTNGDSDCSNFDCSLTPVTVNLPLGFVPAALSRGNANGACAITSGGRLECWGQNSPGGGTGAHGILGDGGNADRNTPGPVYDSSGF